MIEAPLEQIDGKLVGTVEFVSPNEIKVTVDIEAPESMTLNAGAPLPFPRVSGYLLMPVDERFLVGQVEWLTVQHSPFPKRRGLRDFGLIDLPFPLRRLSLSPLGLLVMDRAGGTTFERGADVLPPVGAPVTLPTDDQIRAIVDSAPNGRVKIGTSPLAGDSPVHVDPDRMFGRHLAVLGNTGSGKSCSVAGLIRWSLENAQMQRMELGAATERGDGAQPNARFIILDPNGEYSRAFRDSSPPARARIFKAGYGSTDGTLNVPLWFWNSAEWCSFTQASPRTQRPTLLHALRAVRDGDIERRVDESHEVRRFLRTIVTTIRVEKRRGTPWGDFPKPKSFLEKLEKWRSSLESLVSVVQEAEHEALQVFVAELEKLAAPRRVRYPEYDFTFDEIRNLLKLARETHLAFGGTIADESPADVDAPIPFDGSSLLRSVEAAAEMLNVSEHAETLLVRIRELLTDARMRSVIGQKTDMNLEQWLTDYIGADEAEHGCISVIDLSLVPSYVVHVVAAVIARMVFEALQRSVVLQKTILPTVLVMEEAHTFIKRYRDDMENVDSATICCQVFERIAREGRKFGLGLVLSSQRPSELSPTVLSQCNTFLLHRLNNKHDQDIVARLVPEGLRGPLGELPALPSQMAIVLGWAVELPILVRMNDLPISQQPRSDDPEFWDVWTGSKPGSSAWKDVADDWQGVSDAPEETGDDAELGDGQSALGEGRVGD